MISLIIFCLLNNYLSLKTRSSDNCLYWHYVVSCQVPNLVNTNLPVTAVLPMLVTEVKRLGFKARTGSRSSPKTGCRIQNASKPGVARVAAAEGTAITAKQNQSKQQAEKKNQAINQLRKLLVQGNKRVEALATVIQHLFTEVLLLQTVKILIPPAVEQKLSYLLTAREHIICTLLQYVGISVKYY